MFRFERDTLERKIQTLQNQVKFFEISEKDLRDNLENALAKVSHTEQRLRSMEESVFQTSRENISLQRDLKNMKEIESTMKQEVA